jgi:hypothetical protein
MEIAAYIIIGLLVLAVLAAIFFGDGPGDGGTSSGFDWNTWLILNT